MGWQDAPIVGQSSGQPAWMSAPVVDQPQQEQSSAMEAAKDLGSAIVRPLAQAATFPQMMIENAGVQAYDIAGNVANKLRGKPATPNHELPSEAFEQSLDKVTRRPTNAIGSGAEAISSMIAAPGLGPEKGAVSGVKAVEKFAPEVVERAQKYVAKIGLDWDKISFDLKQKLTSIAKDAKGLDKLKPEAVARVARAKAVGAPISRGQATRDIEQITHEENLSRSSSGKPLRDITSKQDVALHTKLGEVRAGTGGEAETSLQLGKSVQGAERAKLQTLKAAKRLKYAAAKKAGELQGSTDIQPLEDWLSVPANKRNAGFLRSAIDDYKQRAVAMGMVLKTHEVSINDLEEIRKEANVKVGSSDAVESHYAKEAVKQIDKILDSSGGSVYKKARAAHAAEKSEFDRQSLIKKLTSEKGRSSDRAVALEDTFDTTVRRGSNEQLQKLRKSLLEGGSLKTRAKGAQAWKDLQGSTIDYLRESASGKRGTPGEDEQLEFKSGFIDAFDELDKDGKLDVLFGKEAKGILKQIRDATVDLRTKPSMRVSGSDTTPRLVALMDKLSMIPGVGHMIGGTGKLIGKVHSLGVEGREVREASRALPGKPKVPAKSRNLIRKSLVPAAMTLQDMVAPAESGTMTLKDEGQ